MLIPNCWYAVLESKELRAGTPLGVRRIGEFLVLWRDNQGRVSVMKDRCPHRSSQLSLGRLVNGRIQCPFHGFEYDSDGACQLIPANGRVAHVPKVFQCAVYPSQEAYGLIWVWYGAPRAEYPPLPWFPDLEGFEYASIRADWDADMTRAVEGLLDVSHLPFVHRRTIGRGAKTLVNGPYTTLEGDIIRVWTSNQPDEGLPAIKPSQLPPPTREPSLEFRFPNLWQLRLSDRARLISIIAPVEDGQCAFYVRSYFRLSIPRSLNRILAKINGVFNRYVLAEDYPMVRSQRPKVGDLDIGETFIPADRPVAIYLQAQARVDRSRRGWVDYGMNRSFESPRGRLDFEARHELAHSEGRLAQSKSSNNAVHQARKSNKTPFAKLAQPATRALAAAGYKHLEQLASVPEASLTRLHGMGPHAVGKLRDALKEIGLAFAVERMPDTS